MPAPTRRLPLQQSVLDAAGFLSLQERMSKDLFAFDAERRRDEDANSLTQMLEQDQPDYAAGITGTTGYEDMLAPPDLQEPETTPEAAAPASAPTEPPARRSGLLELPTLGMPESPTYERQPIYNPTQTIDISGPPDYDPTEDAGTFFSRPSAQSTDSSSTSSGTTDPSSWEGKAYAAAVKAGHPNPTQFVEQMRWESGNFDPDVIAGNRTSSGGAEGIAQIVRRYHPDVDPLNPDAALDYAARLMKSHYDQYGDSDTALIAYNGGAGAVAAARAGHPYAESQQYLREINSRVTERAQAENPSISATQRASEGRAQAGEMAPAWGTYTPETLTPNQFSEGREQGLSAAEAAAVCGPAAAVAFARANGRNPTLREAKELGASLGVWNAGQGMAGPASEVTLLQKMGVPARLQQGVDWGAIRSEVEAGRPVIVDSPGHYWVATGYDARTGEFEFGASAGILTAARGKTKWRPEDIPGLGMGAPRATIFMGQ